MLVIWRFRAGVDTGDAGITYLPLAPPLCDPDGRIRQDGQRICFDDDHLNSHGAARTLGPVMQDLHRVFRDATATVKRRGTVAAGTTSPLSAPDNADRVCRVKGVVRP